MRIITKTLELLTLSAFLGLAGFAVTGCEREGPLEEAGEEIDDAIDDAREGVEDVADEIEERLE